MNAQKRMILAFVLIILVLFLYQLLLMRNRKGGVPASREGPGVVEEGETTEKPPLMGEAPERPSVEERGVLVETDLLRVTVANTGVQSIQLKGYRGLGGGWIEEVEELKKLCRTEATDRLTKEVREGYKGVEGEELPRWVERIEKLVKEVEAECAVGKDEIGERAKLVGELPFWLENSHEGWVELIPYGKRALSLEVPGIDLRVCPFRIEADTLADGKRVRFIYLLPTGEGLTEELTFKNGRYTFGLKIIGGEFDYFRVGWVGGLAVTEENKSDDLGYSSAVASFGETFKREGLLGLKRKGEKGWRQEGTVNWVGLRTKYFLACMIPEGPVKGAAFEVKFDSLGLGAKEERAALGCMRGQVVEGRASVALSTRGRELEVYAGPLDYEPLRRMGIGLERVVDLGWGWISPISRGILALFKTLYRVIHNYGVVIIAFSCLMMGLFFPLTRRSLHQMQEMQKLQPKMESLRKRLKNEPQKMNAEMMRLYREHGVNPFSGCLPFVFQMPVFFALFSVLRSTIELRRAGFVFWIDDLSIPDTVFFVGDFGLHVLPVLMLGSMIVQQRFTPMDPRQKTMGYMMPVIFTFIFWNLPAGLVLYWLTYNVLSIIQHYLIRRGGTEGKEVS